MLQEQVLNISEAISSQILVRLMFSFVYANSKLISDG